MIATKNDDEKKLVEAAQKDPESLGKLYEAYNNKIRNYILSKVNNDKYIADDLTSSIFEKMVSNIKNYKWQGITFSAWLYRIANNTLIDYYRAYKNTKKLDENSEANVKDPNLNVEESLTTFDSASRIRSLLNKLNTREKEIVMLKFYEGYTNKEISDKLGISESNVGTIVHRSIIKLRQDSSLQSYI